MNSNKDKDFCGSIPSGIVLGGPSNLTTRFSQLIHDEVYEKVICKYLNTCKENVQVVLINMLSKAKENYINSGKRTLIMCDDVERLFSITEQSSNLVGRDLNERDKQILKNINHDSSQTSFFKTLLDTVHIAPKSNSLTTPYFATSFLMTSENPHLIDPDLAERNGKLQLIRMEVPKDENLRDVILDSINDYDINFEDPLNDEDWDYLLKYLNPNEQEGALSLGQIECIMMYYFESANRLTNTNVENLINVIRVLLNSIRDVSPADYKQMKHSSDFFETSMKNGKQSGIELLIEQNQMGLLTPAKEKLLKEKIDELKVELNKIKNLNSKYIGSRFNNKLIQRKEKIEYILDLYNKSV